jgi:hypothetical protein
MMMMIDAAYSVPAKAFDRIASTTAALLLLHLLSICFLQSETPSSNTTAMKKHT